MRGGSFCNVGGCYSARTPKWGQKPRLTGWIGRQTAEGGGEGLWLSVALIAIISLPLLFSPGAIKSERGECFTNDDGVSFFLHDQVL